MMNMLSSAWVFFCTYNFYKFMYIGTITLYMSLLIYKSKVIDYTKCLFILQDKARRTRSREPRRSPQREVLSFSRIWVSDAIIVLSYSTLAKNLWELQSGNQILLGSEGEMHSNGTCMLECSLFFSPWKQIRMGLEHHQ